MKQIRKAVFETNSSSTHTFTMSSDIKECTDIDKLYAHLDKLLKENHEDFLFNLYRTDEDQRDGNLIVSFNHGWSSKRQTAIKNWKEKFDFWVSVLIYSIIEDVEENKEYEDDGLTYKNIDNLEYLKNLKYFRAFSVVINSLMEALEIPTFSYLDSFPLKFDNSVPVFDESVVPYSFYVGSWMEKDKNGNVSDMKEEYLLRIAINIIDPEAVIIINIEEGEEYKFKDILKKIKNQSEFNIYA